MHENDISYIIRGAAFKVHSALGAGLLESVYETVLAYEIAQKGLEVKTQIPVPMMYADIKFDVAFRLDIIVEDKVIVEVKSVAELLDVHHKQLLTYLKLTNKKLGLLINFNSSSLNQSIIRIVNKL
jgi:GxxExxY protein